MRFFLFLFLLLPSLLLFSLQLQVCLFYVTQEHVLENILVCHGTYQLLGLQSVGDARRFLFLWQSEQTRGDETGDCLFYCVSFSFVLT
jgi:hypothetical protein